MLLGILSDSHGHVAPVRTALSLFDRLGVESLVHCGDVGDELVFDLFVGRSFAFVWGNTDYPSGSLMAYLESVGINPPQDQPLHLELEGKRFAVFHGHEPTFGGAALNLDVDYILHGHTHEARDERINGRHVINPGALHRANPKTVATLDLSSDSLQFHQIDK